MSNNEIKKGDIVRRGQVRPEKSSYGLVLDVYSYLYDADDTLCLIDSRRNLRVIVFWDNNYTLTHYENDLIPMC